MKNKIIIITVCCIIVAAFTLGLTGVLSIRSKSLPREQGEYIGIYMTTRALPMHNAIVTEAKEGTEYRLFSIVKEIPETDSNGNTTYIRSEHTFNDGPGAPDGAILISPTYRLENAGAYVTLECNPVFSTSKICYIGGNSGSSIEINATVYLAPEIENIHLYVYPVYQLSSGEIYLTDSPTHPKEVFALNPQLLSDGYSYLFWETIKKQVVSVDPVIASNNNITVKTATTEPATTFSIELTFRYADVNGSVSFLQYDKNGNLLAVSDFNLGDIPDEFLQQTDTDYIVVKSVNDHSNVADQTQYILFDKEELTSSSCYFDYYIPESTYFYYKKRCRFVSE